MMMRAARFAPILVTLAAASAHADEVQTTTAGTVIVVAPSAPVIVPTAPTAPAAAPVAAPGAVAEVAPVPAPNAPPQNEAWSNVSHINGTPVPVGERNRYLYQFRKNEITVNPFGPFWGYYDLAAAHAVSQNIAVQGSISAWDYDNSYHTGYQLTASLPIYLRRTFSGPFLEPGVIIRESNYNDNYCYDGSYNSGCGGTTHRWAGPEMLFGWQSTFDSGLTVKFAFGVAKHMATNDGMSSSDDTDVNGYFRVGYAF
ncbi:MAG: hypothetical protein JO257_12380 [Deltaproteobacteria bacterium]|nr:hypothetical protein [Deltaproteobacteria bacterium]